MVRCALPPPKPLLAHKHTRTHTHTAAEFSQSAPPQLEVTQIAARPDTGSLVEQITYLTSWPQSNTSVCTNEMFL